MKVIMESYTEIQDFKNAMNAECDKMVKEMASSFAPKRIEILKQMDEYLLGVCKQLEGKKSCLYFQGKWYFSSNEGEKRNDTYPSLVQFEIMTNGTYVLKLKRASSSYSETAYLCTLQNGHIKFLDMHNFMQEKEVEYAEILISNWKDLKKNINDTIIKDLKKAQDTINARANKISERNEMYNNFEI